MMRTKLLTNATERLVCECGSVDTALAKATFGKPIPDHQPIGDFAGYAVFSICCLSICSAPERHANT